MTETTAIQPAQVSARRASLHRLRMLTGDPTIERLGQVRVALFGLGGVGGWCAEALLRSGVLHLTLVDSDVVCVTNINRQLQAMPHTVGQSKVLALCERLRQINPEAQLDGRQAIYEPSTAESFELGSFDYVLDAIDSLSNKVDLIIRASEAGAKVFSSLGAANRLDPTKIRVASVWQTAGCPLGRVVRRQLRQRGFDGDLRCVFSEESRQPLPDDLGCGTARCLCPRNTIDSSGQALPAHEWCSSKRQINGSAVHVTGAFGFTLAGLVIQDLMA